MPRGPWEKRLSRRFRSRKHGREGKSLSAETPESERKLPASGIAERNFGKIDSGREEPPRRQTLNEKEGKRKARVPDVRRRKEKKLVQS